MPFVCAGHPSLDTTAAVLPALERAGASIVEIGFPFSDPIADGPVIAEAMHEALQRGVTPVRVLGTIERARRSTGMGIVAMISVSIVQRMGPGAFVSAAKRAGIDGLIVPDAPVDEAESLGGIARDAGLTMSLLVAPTTPPQRAERIVAACTGFVYVLARVGITGESDSSESNSGPAKGSSGWPDSAALGERISMLRSMTDLPIACGFGIASAEHVAMVVRSPPRGAGADAAIVGSALVRRMGRSGAQAVDNAEGFVRSLAHGLEG